MSLILVNITQHIWYQIFTYFVALTCSVVKLLYFVLPGQLILGHITTGSFVGRANQYIQLVKVLYCKWLAIRKQLPTFPNKVWGLNGPSQKWEASVLPLRHCGSLGKAG